MILGFGLGYPELAIIVVVALLIFGPTKLPQLGSSVGKMLRGFKDEIKEMESESEQAKAESTGEQREIDVTPVSSDADSSSRSS